MSITWQDYARAEAFLPWNVAKLAFKLSVEPHWLDERGRDERFWYRNRTRDGADFVLVDPAHATSTPAFDHQRLAAALSQAAGSYYEHNRLPFEQIEFVDDGRALRFDIGSRRWTCRLDTYACTSEEKPGDRGEAELRSPDGNWAAFVRGHNLWVRRLDGGEEIQLTDDGAEHAAYATPPEGRTTAVTDRLRGKKIAPNARWSPDSKRIVTHRLDERNVEELHLLQALPGDGRVRPVLHRYRYAMPGDEHVPLAELVIVDVATRAVTPVNAPPLVAGAFSPFDMNLVWWTEDNSHVAFVDLKRGFREAWLCVADAASGAVRTLLTERGKTLVLPNHTPFNHQQVWVSNDTNEAIWFSQRDGWGHLYLFDTSGAEPKLTRQITRGPWTTRELQHVDAVNRVVYFTAGGREPGRDPYYRHLYRVGFDGSDLELLTPEDADHQISFTPGKGYFIDTYSRVDQPPRSVLRAAGGRLVRELEEADVEPLLATGWRYPERFRVKARDGVTDIYGIIIRPTHFDPEKQYPVLDGIYPGPQIIRTPKAFPDTSPRGSLWHDQSLAELGFIIVNIDGMGTPFRSKAFLDHQYGRMEEAGGLEDHIAALRQLATRYPQLDLDRVGIYGHSGGGYASVRAMLAHPDFYKVAVSSAGNHDQRGYLAEWGELYIGCLEGDNYLSQVNLSLAARLAGKLLLAYGEMDDNVHPALTIQLMDALIKANKDFDLLVLPNGNHAFADLGRPSEDEFGTTTNNLYFLRRRWDYFVQHLLGAEPPSGYQIREQGVN
jgi:dipeptidyl aminopeptidase/acylaminoacyl peptidase